MIAILAAAALLTLFAYVDRLYTEMGKFFLRGVEDNLQSFESNVEPSLHMDRGRAGLTFALVTQGMILVLAVLVSLWAFGAQILWSQVAGALVLLGIMVLVFGHMIPHVLITRTRGDWLVHFLPLLRVVAWAAAPAVVVLSFSFTVSDLAKPEADENPPSPTEDIEALMDKGEEHGVLDQEDRPLIQSVVEFGDKIVRDVMTPRPKIVAVECSATLEELLDAVSEKHFSRIPVYQGTLDNVEGIVYTRELIQLTDQELKQTHARDRMRPVFVVPETKRVADLLRELQQQQMHMAMVVDEYGGVSGLATIEDLLEEIVGEIRDGGEKQPDAIEQPDGSLLISGQAALDELEKYFGSIPEHDGDPATVAGLVNTLAGKVPHRGEVIEAGGLRFEVLESSERLVARVRVSRANAAPTVL